MALLPATPHRVELHSSDYINARNERELLERVEIYRRHPDWIGERLEALDREWDIERALETNAASVSLAGFALGYFMDRRFYALPALVSAFLLQHALQGWCPPLPLLRRMGIRTSREIETERRALLGALRESLPTNNTECHMQSYAGV